MLPKLVLMLMLSNSQVLLLVMMNHNTLMLLTLLLVVNIRLMVLLKDLSLHQEEDLLLGLDLDHLLLQGEDWLMLNHK